MVPTEAGGYLLLYKRPGLTSFDSLSQVKRAFGTRRVGHAGTLDKFARGLLIVLVGRSTRMAQWFSGSDKVYEAEASFGTQTDTLDPEGDVVASAPPPGRAALLAVLDAFRGPILQAPPLYSAVHVDGKRAHELARSGADVEMEARPVEIRSLELLSYDEGNSGEALARLRVACSKGTYIRSLARDIALAAGSRAHLVGLERLSVAGFSAADAVDPLSGDDPAEVLRSALRPVDAAAFRTLGYPVVTAEEDLAREVLQGKPLKSIASALGLDALVDGPVAVAAEDGRLLAVVQGPRTARSYAMVVRAD